MGFFNNTQQDLAGNISSSSSSSSSSGPAYARVSSIPSWLPTGQTAELEEQYRDTGRMFDPTGYNVANRSQQSRVLTTALNAGNNAATDYANRARQAGGNGMGAGLIKAQAAVGARATAGAMELDRAKYESEQREKAASHASQIASTLGTLRMSYLSSLVNYATSEDQISSSNQLGSRNADLDERRVVLAEEEASRKNRGGGYSINRLGQVSNLYGNILKNNSNFNPATGQLAHGGG